MIQTSNSKPATNLTIFDFDGVVVDSETICIKLLIEYMENHGLKLSDKEAYIAFLGKPIGTVHQSVYDLFRKTVPVLDEVAFKAELFKRFASQLKPIPEISWALTKINGPKCIASSSSADRIERSLEITGLDSIFAGRLFGSGTVKKGKPAPDLFLHAAAQQDVSPSNCIVIEDSPAGITAAKAAGMLSIGFVGGSHAEPANLKVALAELEPDLIISSMLDLPAAILKLRKQC